MEDMYEGTRLELEDYDELYADAVATGPVSFINDVDLSTIDSREEYINTITATYQGDDISTDPSCICGFTRTNSAITCERCGTRPVPTPVLPMRPSMWIRPPDGIEGLISITGWRLISQMIKSRVNFDLLHWVCSTTARPPARPTKQFNVVRAANLKRGYNNFIRNFDEYIPILLGSKDGCSQTQIQWILDNKHLIICNYIPVPSRLLLPKETRSKGTCSDPHMKHILDALQTVASLKTSIFPLTLDAIGNKMATMQQQLAVFAEETSRVSLGGKPGEYRKHVFGSRLPLTFRGVITSIPTRHDHDELWLPWNMGLGLYKPLVIGYLINNHGYDHRTVYSHINTHANLYCPLIDEAFKWILKCDWIETWSKEGAPVLWGRNPTLARLSIMLCRVTRIKPDVSDLSVSMSLIACNGSTADFDGDEMNGHAILTDAELATVLKFDFKYGVLDTSAPRTLSTTLKHPAQTTAILDEWLGEPLIGE